MKGEQATRSWQTIETIKNELESYENMVGRFQWIIDALPEGIIYLDNSLKILAVNKALQSQFGFSEDELIGESTEALYKSSEFFTQSDREIARCVNRGEKGFFETDFRKKDGTVFPGELLVSTVKNSLGENIGTIALVREITRRRNLENSLRQLEFKFRTIVDFTCDLECWEKPEGGYYYISPSCKKVTGYPAEIFLDDPLMVEKIIHPEDRKIWRDHRHYLVNRDDDPPPQNEIQFRIIGPDGGERWIEHSCQPVFDKNGKFVGVRSSSRDITKRKNSEIGLRRALKEIEEYKEKLEAESDYLKKEIEIIHSHASIIGNSNALQYVLFKIEQIANTNTLVLVLGETGTGKELFVRAIHATSRRKDRPLVTINCAALTPSLIESELFGHEKGSFTGAYERKIGRFELAHRGTIFLDEIGEMPLELQAKLLRVLQEGEIERIGGSKTITVDARVIVATNRNLEEEVRKGTFRKDLWYRLNVYPISAPPLRQRKEDIPQLVKFFIDKFSKSQGKSITNIPSDVMSKLQEYSWPGNIRELGNIIERAVINSTTEKLDMPDVLKPNREATTTFTTLAELEKEYILKVLEKTNWKISGKNSAAEILGLQRGTLRARMAKHGIVKPAL